MPKLLHEVIIDVIQKAGKPLPVSQITRLIKDGDLWKRPKDGLSPDATQVSARVANYSKYFLRKDGVVSLVDGANNTIRMARLTFNSNGWQYPSGWRGKSKAKSSYETTNGYGHEEWLLDFTKIIDGHHYGFLEPINKSRLKYVGSTFDIFLFTVNSETNERLWIGKLNNVEVITTKESERAKGIYEKKGWFAEMKEDLEQLEIDGSKLDKWKGFDLFNIRFKPEDFEKYPDNTYVSDDDKSISSYHYVLLHMKEDPIIEKEADGQFILGRCNPLGRYAGKTVKKKYEEKYVEHPVIHNQISRALEQTLLRDFDEVYAEHQTGYKTSIDLVAVKGKKINFYEIKTYNDVRTCIRMALGQLLEYSYYPERKLANEMFIVTPHQIEDSTMIKFIQHLRTSVGLPLRYLSYDLPSKSITQII